VKQRALANTIEGTLEGIEVEARLFRYGLVALEVEKTLEGISIYSYKIPN